MGRGDKRTKKGKIKARSHGNKRPHSTPTVTKKPAAAAKAK
jgi:ribosomal small subunit protein bTHX